MVVHVHDFELRFVFVVHDMLFPTCFFHGMSVYHAWWFIFMDFWVMAVHAWPFDHGG